MLKSFVRAAGFTAYFLITLEMIFMVTPFALYYYSAYAPFLSGASSVPGLAWLPAFFLPHLSTDIVPSVGGLILFVGIGGFLIGALQIYFAKFRKRGVVASGLYKRVRHPQYFFLGVAGLGLLIVWPRFILLIIYVNMLWFYYLLARSEEEQMRFRHGDAYLEPMRRAPMFIPGEPGGHLAHLLFGWVSNSKLRLSVIYCVSLVVALGGGFAFRELSLRSTTHLSLADEKIAAVSLMPSARTQLQLRELVELARSDRDVQDRLNQQRGWILMQVADGKASATHVMIDAGMTRRQANSLPISGRGIELVFLQRKDGNGDHPFRVGARWQPMFIAEVNGEKVSQVVDIPASLFRGNPLMPIF
jgi:protein-S-isoprenylcysteine O-methyltransferase Ste14